MRRLACLLLCPPATLTPLRPDSAEIIAPVLACADRLLHLPSTVQMASLNGGPGAPSSRQHEAAGADDGAQLQLHGGPESRPPSVGSGIPFFCRASQH